jgi:hypothetical protein
MTKLLFNAPTINAGSKLRIRAGESGEKDSNRRRAEIYKITITEQIAYQRLQDMRQKNYILETESKNITLSFS